MTNQRGACLGAELQTNPLQHCKSGPQRVVFSLKQRVLVYQMVSESGIKTSPLNLDGILFVHGDELVHKNAEVTCVKEQMWIKSARDAQIALLIYSEFDLFHSNAEKP